MAILVSFLWIFKALQTEHFGFKIDPKIPGIQPSYSRAERAENN